MGLAAGTLCMPARLRTWQKVLFLAGFGILANVPDLPFSHWGHQAYLVSHSLFVNLALIADAWVLWWAICRLYRWRFRLTVVLAATFTWLSHFLMDALYRSPDGVKIFWPFSTGALALPLPWLSYVDLSVSPVAPCNLRVYLMELITFGPFLCLAVLLRAWWLWSRRDGHLPAT